MVCTIKIIISLLVWLTLITETSVESIINFQIWYFYLLINFFTILNLTKLYKWTLLSPAPPVSPFSRAIKNPTLASNWDNPKLCDIYICTHVLCCMYITAPRAPPYLCEQRTLPRLDSKQSKHVVWYVRMYARDHF